MSRKVTIAQFFSMNRESPVRTCKQDPYYPRSFLLLETKAIPLDSLFLNPQVSEDCTDLWLDYAYCIKPVGVITTYNGYDGYTTRPPLNETSMTQLPPGHPGVREILAQLANRTLAHPFIPLASGTRRDCYR